MTKTNKKAMLELCIYYKGEDKNPFEDQNNNKKHYWNYERRFFDNPNVFQSSNMEEDFKTEIQSALDGPIAENFQSLDRAIRDYFNNA